MENIDFNFFKKIKLNPFSDTHLLKNLFEFIASGVWIADKNDSIFYVNKSMAKIAGITKKQFMGLKIPDSFSKETTEYFFPLYLKAKKTLKPLRYKSLQVITPKKRDSLQSGWLIPVIKDSQYFGMICIVEDVTYESRYTELFNRSQNCVAVYKPINDGEDFVFEDFNKSAEKVDKIKKHEVLGRKLTDVFPSVKEYGLFEVLQKVYKSGIAANHSIAFYKDDRISGWRDNHIYKTSTGEIVSVYRDLTAVKQAGEELIKTKERLQLAKISAKAGLLEWDITSKKITFDKELFNLFGFNQKKRCSNF